MASPIFQGKVNLTQASQTSDTTWDVEFTFLDADGVFGGDAVQVGDILFLDTSAFELGTITKYRLTAISYQDFGIVQGTIEFSDNNSSVPDVGFSLGVDGAISRPTPKLGLAIVPAPGTQQLPDKFAVYPKNTDTLQIIDNLGSGGGGWLKYTLTAQDLATPDVEHTVTLFSIPAAKMIEKVLIKHDTPFTGGTLSAVTVEVGVAEESDRYATPFNVSQPPSNNAQKLSISGGLESLTDSVDLVLTAKAEGGTLDEAESGSVTVWIQTSDLP